MVFRFICHREHSYNTSGILGGKKYPSSKTYFTFKQLKERQENNNHFDYVCPVCECVIICSNKKVKL